MTPIELAEIHFYVDGELGPDEAAEVEARFERNSQQAALFETLWRQKEIIARAIASLEVASSANDPRPGLPERLAELPGLRFSYGHPDPMEVAPDG